MRGLGQCVELRLADHNLLLDRDVPYHWNDFRRKRLRVSGDGPVRGDGVIRT